MPPLPLEWIEIPPGEVTLREYVETRQGDASRAMLQTYGVFTVPAFRISKHPVTNAQFAPFVEAGGYQTARFWSAEGWQHKEQGQWAGPRFWQSSDWNGPDYPVVGVSFYEAQAFCQWLSAAAGEPVTLPSEPQWQRAAQGEDGRDCPWGAWDEDEARDRCNVSLVVPWGAHRTTPANYYEGVGDSPFGVVDQLGNVAEWTLTPYRPLHNDETAIPWQVTCGSWNPYWYGHLHSRTGSRQDFRNSDTGFRLCRSAASSLY